MLYNVRFEKLHAAHNRLRDGVVVGWTNDLPEVGQPFSMLAPPRDVETGLRQVTTSEITYVAEGSISDEGLSISFTTRSGSYYRVLILNDGVK